MNPRGNRGELELWLLRVVMGAFTIGACVLVWLALGQSQLVCPAPRSDGVLACKVVHRYPFGVVRRVDVEVTDVAVERVERGGARSSYEVDGLVINAKLRDREVLSVDGDVRAMASTLDAWRLGRERTAAPLVLTLDDGSVFGAVLFGLLVPVLGLVTFVLFALPAKARPRRRRRRG